MITKEEEGGAKGVDFYKKRYDDATLERNSLKTENKALREELNSMKEFVKKIVIPKNPNRSSPMKGLGDEDMVTLLDFQRKRIDTLERELVAIRTKYESAIFVNQKGNSHQPESVSRFEKETSIGASLSRANERINQLETQLKELMSSSAKEITTLKQRLADNDTTLVISANESNKSLYDISRPLSKNSLNQSVQSMQTLRDLPSAGRDSKKRLEPMNQSQDLAGIKKQSEDSRGKNDGVFAYKQYKIGKMQ